MFRHVFKMFFEELGLFVVLRKNGYIQLAQYIPKDLIDEEIIGKLGSIVKAVFTGASYSLIR